MFSKPKLIKKTTKLLVVEYAIFAVGFGVLQVSQEQLSKPQNGQPQTEQTSTGTNVTGHYDTSTHIDSDAYNQAYNKASSEIAASQVSSSSQISPNDGINKKLSWVADPNFWHRMTDMNYWSRKYVDIYNDVASYKIIYWSWWLFGMSVALYVIEIILRMIYGYQRPLWDDYESWSLRKKVIHRLKGSANRERRKKDKPTTTERKVAKIIADVQVQVQTASNETHYQVRIPISQDEDVKRIINSKLNKFEQQLKETASRGRKTPITFGELYTSRGYIYKISDASIEYKPKSKGVPEAKASSKNYDKNSDRDRTNEQIEQDKFVPSFPLSLFADNTKKIEAIRGEAQKLGEDYTEGVTIILESNNVQADYLETYTGNSNIQISYRLTYTTKLPDLEALSKKLSNNLDMDGVQTSLKGKKLIVMVPIPLEKHIPIDLPTIFKQNLSKNGLEPTFALFGIEPDGTPVIRNLSAMPHLLVAGTTGSGKSVFINQLIFSTMYHNTPKNVKFVMVDPKNVEFGGYAGSPFLLFDVVTSLENAVAAIVYLSILMDNRYREMSKYKVKKIDAYNKKMRELGREEMPYIEIYIDEFSNLIGQYPEIRMPVKEVGEKGRAAGLDMVIATQTPRAEVFPGIIKANVPGRVALNVANSTESDIVLDQPGAEKLMGKGDMLIKTTSGTTRAQGGFINDDETEAIQAEILRKYEPAQYVDYLHDKQVIEKMEHYGFEMPGTSIATAEVQENNVDPDIADAWLKKLANQEDENHEAEHFDPMVDSPVNNDNDSNIFNMFQ